MYIEEHTKGTFYLLLPHILWLNMDTCMVVYHQLSSQRILSFPSNLELGFNFQTIMKMSFVTKSTITGLTANDVAIVLHHCYNSAICILHTHIFFWSDKSVRNWNWPHPVYSLYSLALQFGYLYT